MTTDHKTTDYGPQDRGLENQKAEVQIEQFSTTEGQGWTRTEVGAETSPRGVREPGKAKRLVEPKPPSGPDLASGSFRWAGSPGSTAGWRPAATLVAAVAPAAASGL